MLRNLIKFTTRKVNTFSLLRPHIVQPSTLYKNPVYYFSNNETPKGFEKFNRRRKPSTEHKKEESDKPKEQRVDIDEDLEQETKRDKRETSESEKPSSVRPSEKKETESAKTEQEKKHDTEKAEEKTKEKVNKKKEEEEHIENEEEKPRRKQKKEDANFDFNINFKWDYKTGGKDGPKGWDPKTPMKFSMRHFVLLSVVGFLFLQSIIEYYYDRDTVTYVEFVRNYLETDKISKIGIRRINDGTSYKTVAILDVVGQGEKTLVLGNVDNFLENLERYQLEKGKTAEQLIPIEFEQRVDANKVMDRMINFFYMSVTVAILYFIFRQMRSGFSMMNKGGSDIFGAGKSQVKIYGLDTKIKTRFKDVAGLEEAKVEITEFVDFLKKPKRFADLGAKIPRGALLTGPPGTGKTLLAKAAAGEAGVPFLYLSGSDFVEMFVGVGASRVRDLFKKAKEHAPSIIFIDEIDAVGRKRESKFGGNDERDNTLNQLLVEMDGFGTDNNVIVLAATNRKELLDPALTRPGRFDRSIEVTLPDIEGRKQIFMVHLTPLKLDPEKSIEEYAKRLATLTPGFSGADIANLCNEAAIMSARRNKKFVGTEEFESASERVMAGLEKKRIISEEERRVVAYHESGHAVVSWFLEGGYPLLKLTIIPRSKGSLGFAQYLPNESSLETKEELMDRITSILGGRCAEEVFNNGKITTGAYDDLQKAYDIANNMITKFGMSESLGYIGFSDDTPFNKHSDITAKQIDNEIKKIIDECTKRARDMVRKHKEDIEKLATGLLEKETLDLKAIIGILGERPFEPKSNFKAYLESKKESEKEEEEKRKRREESEEGKEGEDSGEGGSGGSNEGLDPKKQESERVLKDARE